MPAPISAVLFDFDHTLGIDNHLEERVMRLLAQRLCGIDPSDADIANALERFRSGSVSLAQMLADAFSAWGYSGDVESIYKFEALRLLPDSLVPTPNASETLRGLSDIGMTVAILTNGWTELQLSKAALIGFEGPVFASEEIGAWKPDNRAFDIASSRLGIPLAESMYVGDSPPSDVAGAKKAGMVAVWADLEHIPYPSDVAAPDYAITSLDALVPLVTSLGN